MAKYKIILADDHAIFLEGLKGLIDNDKDFQVVAQAQDGRELLDRLQQVKCDIVVTDLSMPHTDGMSAISTIRKQYPRIKILVLTMLKDHEHFKHAMANGASGYMLKDDAYNQFSLALKMIMKGKRFVSQSVETLLTERYLRSLDETEDPSLNILTKREQQILKFIAQGLANKNIASRLKLSIRTVEAHRANLTNKLGIKSTAGLVRYALAKGLS